jgi:cyclic-di-AMP phosphodiesterase PgpH
MVKWAARLLERNLRITNEQAHTTLHMIGLTGAVLLFALAATVLVAADAIFAGGRNVSTLQVGDIAQQNIRAPIAITYVSDVLTQRSREEAANAIPQVYDPPDANVLRNQTQLARQILDFIKNVRRDPFGTTEQKIDDINKITALTLDESIIRDILEIDDETWQAVDDQVVNVLERMMRESIREGDLSTVLNQLPTQVSIRFTPEETAVVVAIVQDLIRPNTFPNPIRTEEARLAAAEATDAVPRTFARNEIVVREGKVIDAVDFEALEQLGLLRPEEFRIHEVARAFLSSVLVMIVSGLYIARFRPDLFSNSRFTFTLVVIFLMFLAGARTVGYSGVIYGYPTSAMALLFSAIVAPQIAIIGVLGLGVLTGAMLNNSLEIFVLVTMSGIIGALMLRRTERLSSFFLSGLLIGLTNILVVAVFNLGTTSPVVEEYDVSLLLIFSLLNGLLSAALAIAGLYAVTLLFNLPTSLKLAELAQPSQPLLQRLLREAPGTYQHSLQVANLSEQAALAVGADSELLRVAALYHDIGKMLNPAFFTENLPFGGGNPHDVLNDPYRSADIIISHVTDGDEMAEQHHLPGRLRDFIREHHGTTLVYVFYRRSIELAGGDESEVDITEFTYPGPRPL